MVGRATFIDPANRVNIVDWRNAPISQLYYRYEEGSDYEERFGDREVEGEICRAPDRHHRGRGAGAGGLPAGVVAARAGRLGADGSACARAGRRRGQGGAPARPDAGPEPVCRLGVGWRSAGGGAGHAGAGAAAAGPPPARDRRPGRSPAVRADHHTALGRGGDPGRGGQRQDHHRPAPDRLPGLRGARSLPPPSACWW